MTEEVSSTKSVKQEEVTSSQQDIQIVVSPSLESISSTISETSSEIGLAPMPANTTQQQIVLPSEMKSKFKLLNSLRNTLRKNKKEMKGEDDTATTDPVVTKQSWQNAWKQMNQFMKKAREMCIGKAPAKMHHLREEDVIYMKTVIIDLIYAFLSFGTPVFRIEYHVNRICTFFGVNSCYLDATGTGFLITFANSFEDNQVDTRFIKVKSTALDLSKICLLDDVADEIASNRITLSDAQRHIKEIVSRKPKFAHPLFAYFAYTVTAVMISIILYNPWPEVITALLIGLYIATLTILTPRIYPQLSQIHQTVCSIGAGLIAIGMKALFARFKIGFSVNAAVLGGVFLLLPGLSLTISFSEMSRRQWRSGLIRLVTALTSSAQIAAGLMVTHVIEQALGIPVFTREPFYYPTWAQACLLPCASISFMVAFKAPHYPLVTIFIIANTYVPLFVSRYVTQALGRLDLGTFVGAFCMQTVSKLYGWLSRHPPSVVSSCAILFCVPGGWSVKGIDAFFSKDSTLGTELIFQMVSVAIALALGMLMANFIVPLGHKHELRQIRKFLKRLHDRSKSNCV